MRLMKPQLNKVIYLLLFITLLLSGCTKNDTEKISSPEIMQDIKEEDSNTITNIPATPFADNENVDDIESGNLSKADGTTSSGILSSDSTTDNGEGNDKDSDEDSEKDIHSYSLDTVSDDKNDIANKKIIAIDAGHQSKGNYEKEPIGPGSKTMKPKVSSGTQGTYTKVPEYKLTLVIAKKVKEELINRGYEVVMIREKNSVNLSNKERAEIANESGADAFIRIHADGSTNSSVKGASTLYPSKKNPYVPELSKDSYSLSKSIIDAFCESTGAKNRGAIQRDDMSGINWCTVPVTIIEMGYMTNKTEDKLMQTEEYQEKMVQGICNGIDNYFE